MKYSSLIILILINGIYLFLPCVTDFSAYVVVPWLSLCFLEWGLQYRLYDLILAFYTSILILLLIVANVAILVKVSLLLAALKFLKSVVMPVCYSTVVELVAIGAGGLRFDS